MPEADSAATSAELLLNPAVQLFVQRATAAQPRFALTARNASAVAQICRRLDGIPLALELAAARVEVLTAEQMARRLDQRFRLLTGGSRAALAPPADPGGDARLELRPAPRGRAALFERLSVFAGGWTLEAAEAVCAGSALNGEDVLDVLTHLTRKSLVVADETSDGAQRYWMLETMRDYARQKLASRGVAEINALRDRHAEFFGSLLEQLLPDDYAIVSRDACRDTDALRRIDAEYDNVRAVLAWWLESDRPAQQAYGWRPG